jgi:hypothetical protein
MCHSADRLLFTNSYWTIDGGNHYIYYDPVEISFMSTLRQNDFSEEWTILMSNIPNVVITTTTGNENILDFNLSSGSEFVISFISSMQNGIVEIEEDVSSSSSSESSSFSSSESSVIGSSSSISSNSLSSVSGSLSSSSSSTSSFSTIDVVWDKYDNTIPNASNTISTNGRLARGVSGGDSGGVISPCVIKDGLIYKMWYSDAGETGIFYATSTDGLNWTKYNNASETSSDNVGHDGRIPLGQSGGDVEGVASPSVIKDGHIYKMWYSGYYDASSRWRIYYAYSYDGLTWIKYDNSIPGNSNVTGTNGRIPRGTSGGDSRGAKYPCVIKDGSLYRMWYSGEEGSNDNYRIYYAYSYDGLTWTKYDNSIPASSNKNCTNGRIAKGSGSGRGDSSEVYAPCVVKDGSLYKMWYSGYGYDSSRRIYCAISYDGFTWNKYDNTIPSGSDSYGTKGRIPTGTTNSGIGDRTHAHRCSVIIDNNIYKAWYTGYYSSYDIYCAEG